MIVLEVFLWTAAGLVVWTHVGYPITTALLARVRTKRVRKAESEPGVALIIAAHDEEAVIGRRIENLLALDYPADKLEVVVASDASTDRTDEIVASFADRGVRLIRCERLGKVAAQDRAVRETSSEVVAFSDANALWEPDALRKLVSNLADPEVGYVCGRLMLEDAEGTNREGVYWRYELWLRKSESRMCSITGGNGAIYAVRREDYVGGDPRFGHDLGFPYLMVQRGKRAVYEPAAIARERAAANVGDEFGRKVRMFTQCWAHVLTGRMLKPARPLYYFELISHRLLRYASGLLHVVLLAANIALVVAREGLVYDVGLGAQIALLVAAAVGVGLARYYVSITWATIVGLWRYLRSGIPTTWDQAEGTR